MNDVVKIQRGRTSVLALIAIFILMSPACSGKKTDSSAPKSGPSGEVEVNGSVSDDDPTDFKQADESVQIGGVNLVASSSYQVTVYKATVSGYVQALSQSFPTKEFSFKTKTANALKIEVVRSDGKLIAAVIPAPDGAEIASVKVNGTTHVAAKMYDIAVNKAVSGDATMVKAVSGNLIPVVALIRAATSILLVVAEQKSRNTSAEPLDLTKITASIVGDSVAAAEADSRGVRGVSRSMSRAAYDGVFDPQIASQAGGSPEIAAFRAPTGLPNDVAYDALAQDSAVAAVAYQTYQQNYTTAATPAEAEQNTSAISYQYTSQYGNCVDTDGCRAAVASYQPPAEPPPPEPTTTTTDSGGSTGGTGGGTTTTSGTTGDTTTTGSTSSTCLTSSSKLSDPACTTSP